MRRLFFVLFITAACALLSGCSKEIRYSPEEIKDYPPAIQEHIKNSAIVTGMTTQQVRYAWGAPSTVNVLSPAEDGKPREEWTYSRIGVFKTRLIFTDGRLIEITSTEPGITK